VELALAPVETKPFLIEAGMAGAPEESSRFSSILRAVLVWGVCVLLAAGPLALGGVPDWAVAMLELGAAVLGLLWAVRELASGRIRISTNPLYVPMLLIAAIAALQLALGRTAYWYNTWSQALLWGAYFILFFIASQSFRRSRWLRFFAVFFTIYGFGVALLAIAQAFTAPLGTVYWVIRTTGWVFGPYIDHAHYAGLMELLVPIPLVFGLAGCYERPVRILFGFAALIMASTIFLCQSSGGMISFVVQLLVLALVIAQRRHSRKRLWLSLGILCALLALILVALQPIGGSGLTLGEKLASFREPFGKGDASSRLAIIRDGLRMVRARPWLGWGLGTFADVYPAFRSYYSNLIMNAAHNDYLQALVETGLIGFLAWIAFVVLLFRTGIRKVENWRREARASMALAALVGCTGLLVHGLCDFNLRIPANAALFFVLAALATANRGMGATR
jgi:O-antigen ligase